MAGKGCGGVARGASADGADADEADGTTRVRKTAVRWSEALGARLCARLAAGELLHRILREPGMPTPEGVMKWAKAKPAFGAAFHAARAAGGRPTGSRGPVSTYTEGVGEEIFERVCDGESFSRIGADPTMPSLSTIFNWRDNVPGFEARMQRAMRVRAERMCDASLEIAEAATPETAYLAQVQLGHLRWMTGIMAPWPFRPKLVDPEKPRGATRRVLERWFTVEEDPETGRMRMVAWCPNPDTGAVEREDTPGWRQAPNSVALPGGREA